ncbi:MAG: hypothetical protein ACPGWR_09180 [Ardenticatenaceae bacterium]
MYEYLNDHLLVSCISTKLSILKKYWAKENDLPPLVRGGKRKPPINVGGLLFLLDLATGEIKSQIKVDFPSGISRSEKGIFVATRYAIHEVAPDLSSIHCNLISLPQFNALHSMSCWQNRYLIASTGMDLLVEFDRDGRILWQWWATDHGFVHTPKGHVREIDKEADHRGIDYGTINQTTHINSAVAISDEFVLATLFHQGMVIKICKESGK